MPSSHEDSAPAQVRENPVQFRKKAPAPVQMTPSPAYKPASDARQYERHSLEIPVRLKVQDHELTGRTQDFSPGGFRLLIETALSPGTPLALQCAFSETCYLNVAGQVIFCLLMTNGAEPTYAIGIKFAAIREWEQKILVSTIEELLKSVNAQQQSLLAISVTEDAIALEAGNFHVQTSRDRFPLPRSVRQSCAHASKIIGWGAYLPPQEVTNEDINAWLRREGQKTRFGDVVGNLTGIQSRRYAGSLVYPSDLAVQASVQALRTAGVDPKDLDVIISCGVARDVEEPATACIIQEKLGSHNAYAFDLGNACNGFLSAIDVLDSFIASGRCEVGLVAVGDVLSQYVTWDACSKKDLHLSAMGYTFGDGGGAAVLRRVQQGDQQGIQARWFLSDGSCWKVAVIPLMDRQGRAFKSNATEIERIAAQYIPIGIEEVLEALHWSVNDIDLVIPHQVGIHVVTQILYKRLGIPPEKVSWPFPKYGNVGAASMPIAMCEAFQEGRARQGNKALLVGGSGGFGAAIMGLVI